MPKSIYELLTAISIQQPTTQKSGENYRGGGEPLDPFVHHAVCCPLLKNTYPFSLVHIMIFGYSKLLLLCRIQKGNENNFETS